jgi:hypothetical protein
LLIDYFLCYFSGEGVDGVLPFDLMQDKFYRGNIGVPADRCALSLQACLRTDNREGNVRVQGKVGNCRADFNIRPLIGVYQRNRDQTAVFVQGVEDALNQPA